MEGGNDALSGEAGDDTLYGGSGNDTLIAGSGKDVLYGGANNDTLAGGPDTSFLDIDRLYGEDGNDLLLDHYRADKSSDSLYGGAGNDTLFGGVHDHLFGEAGSDTYWLNGSYAEDSVNSDANIFIAYTGNGALDNQITLNNTVVDNIYVNEGASAFIRGAGANDKFYWGGTLISGTFYQQRIPDPQNPSQFTLGSSLFANFFQGSLYLEDNKGNHIATFDDFTSATIAGMTFDFTYGAAGNVGGYSTLPFTPTFLNAYPDPVAAGTAGNDSISGSYLADSLSGGAGNDTLAGSTGNDTLSGGAGNNTLSGGADKDRFVIAKDTVTAVDTITDFNAGAGEIIDVSALGTGLSLTLTQTGSDASFTVGNRTVLMKNVSASALSTSNFVGVASLKVAVTPTSGSDSLTGSSGADTIDALGGNDTISGLGGNDSIDGGAGNDSIDGGAGNDSLIGGADNDTLKGGDGNDSLTGGDGIDKLYGDAGVDTLTGGAGIDTFHYTIAQVSNTKTSVDTITDFGNGADLVDFTDLTLANLHGTGAGLQKGSATTVLGANTGLFISSTTAAGFTVANIEAAINKVGDDLGADIMYAMVSNNTDTVLVKVRDADNDNNLTDAGDIQFVATITGMNTAALNALTTANFVDW